jgi:hypothetical protein
MTQTSRPAAYSALVKIRLICPDRTIELGQVAPDWIMVDSPVELAPCHGDIELEIDGHISTRRVFLPDGIALDSDLIRVVPVND